MATDTDRVAQIGVEARRIEDPGFALCGEVLVRFAVAGLACDAPMQKRQSLITIYGARLAALDRTHVASEAAALHRQWRRHVVQFPQSGLHVITRGGRVPRHGRLEKIVANRIEVGRSQMSGTEEVIQAHLARDTRLTQRAIRKFNPAVARGYVVLRIRTRVHVRPGAQFLHGQSTRIGHGSLQIALVDLRVTGGAFCICLAHRGRLQCGGLEHHHQRNRHQEHRGPEATG